MEEKGGYIDDSTNKRLDCSDGVLPRAYGVPKIHELDCLLRIIVSSLNNHLYKLSTFLHNIINIQRF